MSQNKEVVAYISGVLFGVTKKITNSLTRSMFTAKEHEYVEKTIGQLYVCKPISKVFSKSRITKLQEIAESGDIGGLMQLAKEETAISDQPWCVAHVVNAVQAMHKCLPKALYQATHDYLYSCR